MTLLIIPILVFLIVAPTPGPPASTLQDFSQFSKAINKRIALIEVDGTEREGVLTAADGDQVTIRLSTGTQNFPRASVVSAERMRDGRIDGIIKGAVVGFVMTAFASQGYDSTTPGYVPWVSVAAYAGAGYLLDAAESNRRQLYRAATQPSPATKLKPGLSLLTRF